MTSKPDKRIRHGWSGSRLYQEWQDMKRRCYNPKNQAYDKYGGRGITVCHEWRNSFAAFRDWSLSNGYQDNLTIDRIDVNGPYSPENCRWATPKEQSNNKRNNRYITYNGKTQTLQQWADETGIHYRCIYTRLRYGWPIERALTEKSQVGRRKKPENR